MPSLAGVRLGATPDAVASALERAPDATVGSGRVRLWRYETEGLLLTLADGRGVTSVVVREPGAADVFGVGVGEPVEELARRIRTGWGDEAAGTRDFSRTGSETMWYFRPGEDAEWVLSVGTREGIITHMGLTYAP